LSVIGLQTRRCKSLNKSAKQTATYIYDPNQRTVIARSERSE